MGIGLISLGEEFRRLYESRLRKGVGIMYQVRAQSWRETGFGCLRIVFGIVWSFDASFKWRPAFTDNFATYLIQAAQGQPHAERAWIYFWINVIKVDPHVFAYFIATAETLIAFSLLLGLFSNLTYIAGLALSIVIWSTAEGLGGPYISGSTDIGAAIIYALVFIALFLANAGRYLGLDGLLAQRLGRLRALASG